MFNNSGDSVRLLDFNKQQKDSFEYFNAIQGKTYGRVSFESDEFCLQEESKGSANNNCLNTTATPTPKPTSTPKPTPSNNPFMAATIKTSLTSKQKSLANGQEISKNTNLLKKIIEQSKPKNLILNTQKAIEGEVLGESIENKKINKPLINGLTFLSLS